MSDQPRHATTVALHRSGRGWIGILLTGPSGAGKSDLALRLLERGARLIADDYTHVFAAGDDLYAAVPERIEGRMEVRGVGILNKPTRPFVRLGLIVDLTTDAIDRLPEPLFERIAGRDLLRIRLNGFEASAVEKVTVLSRRL